jgi:parallel beta-helix repeat protein
MNLFIRLASWAAVASLTLAWGWAAEFTVPGDFPAIQAAIDAAKPGDTVVVHPGRYLEQIHVSKEVTVRSAGDAALGEIGYARAAATIIDSGGKSPAVTMEQGAILDGMTVTGAGKFDQADYNKHYAQRGENLPDERGAVGAGGGSPAISIAAPGMMVRYCNVHDNGHAGIGFTGDVEGSTIKNNQVYRNMGGGIGVADASGGTISGNRCWNNLRAGIGCRNSSPLIENNRCSENVRAGIGIREGYAGGAWQSLFQEPARAYWDEARLHWNRKYRPETE